ncbi:MAG: hypothetical protein E6Q83_19035 [Thiothrix sp.]|nr:MAG: hypothetical protein E6Q83_19035 [Thiothrix sp.]
MKIFKNLCLVTGFAFTLFSCKKTDLSSATSVVSEKKTTLSSIGRLLIPSNTFQEVDAQLLEKCLTKLNISKINKDTYVQPFPIKGISIVLSNGKRIEPDMEGNLYLSGDDFKHMNAFQVYYKDIRMSSKNFIYLKEEHTLIFETTIQDYLSKRVGTTEETNCHSGEKNKGTQTSGVRKTMGRCMDYNGYLSDGGNYPVSDWRSSRNFIGSDCDIAMARGYCWSEHIVRGGCYKTHNGRSCSYLIGHSDDYHQHTFWDRS